MSMSTPGMTAPHAGHEDGYTLVEVLIATAIGLIVSFAAFSVLEFTSSDASRITERAHADQTGRVALEKIMLQLHSACVAVNINPIYAKSTGTAIKFVSETSPLNSNKEPVSSLSTVRLHEIIYKPASGGTEGTLTEKSWPSYGSTPNYLFHNTTETPTERKLLKGIKQSINEKGEEVAIFQYYRYYQTGDTIPTGHLTLPYGEINPAPLSNKEMEKTEEAESVAKITVSFTLAPEGKEGAFAKGDRPVPLEDSATLRLAPASEASSSPNSPCTEQT
jgi:prepilin-type N-terminal cleavage/methylation domain-containing protein